MKPSKYRNVKTTVDGHTFDSRKEADRYAELKMLEKAGEICDLELQPRFTICPAVRAGGVTLRSRSYVADFTYWEGDRHVVEDVKSAITAKNPVYTLKKQLFLSKYGDIYEFRET